MNVESSRWLLRKPSDEAAARIFCFPYSGVGASMFNRWPRWLGRAEVCPIQLPGRENRIREPHFGTYGRLSLDIVEHLLPLFDRPFVFFGHCAGSLPAYETVRRLVDGGRRAPGQLVVSAQVAPHDCPHNRFLELTDAELTGELGQLVVTRGGRPNPMLIALTLDVLHKDLDACRAYTLERPVPLPSEITVVHWSDDHEVDSVQLRGWRHYAESVRFVELPGGHYEFLSGPPALLDVLARAALPPVAAEVASPAGDARHRESST